MCHLSFHQQRHWVKKGSIVSFVCYAVPTKPTCIKLAHVLISTMPFEKSNATMRLSLLNSKHSTEHHHCNQHLDNSPLNYGWQMSRRIQRRHPHVPGAHGTAPRCRILRQAGAWAVGKMRYSIYRGFRRGGCLSLHSVRYWIYDPELYSSLALLNIARVDDPPDTYQRLTKFQTHRHSF